MKSCRGKRHSQNLRNVTLSRQNFNRNSSDSRYALTCTVRVNSKINYNCSQVHHCLYCVWPVNFIHVHFIPFISFGRFQEKSKSRLLFIPILQNFSCSRTRRYLRLHCRKLSSVATKYQYGRSYLYIVVYLDQCNFRTLVQLYFLRKI